MSPVRWLVGTILFVVLFAVLVPQANLGQAKADTWSTSTWTTCNQAGAFGGGGSDSAGNLFISCGTGSILAYGPSGQPLTSIPQAAGELTDVAPSPNGQYLYLALGTEPPRRMTRQAGGNYTLDSAATWSLATYTHTYSWPETHAGAVALGWNITTDQDGNIYITDGGFVRHDLRDTPPSQDQIHSHVLKYSPAGQFITQMGREVDETWNDGEFYHSAMGVAVKPDGSQVFVADQNNGRILRFNKVGVNYQAGTPFGTTAATNPAGPNAESPNRGSCPALPAASTNLLMASPYEIALDDSGNIFVMNTTCNNVLKLNPTGTQVLDRLVLGAVNVQPLPHSFAVSKDGCRVYVNHNSRKLVTNQSCGGAPAAPNTTITSGPGVSTTATSAQFTFSASGTSTGFECNRDGAGWSNCVSPKSYADLAVGAHNFQVRAVNGAVPDPTPASYSWTITTPGGPTCNGKAATIIGSPADLTVNGSPLDDVIVVSGNEEFEIDSGAGNDTICGGPLYDTIRPGSGNDWVSGGGGSNAIDYSFATQGMDVDLETGTAQGRSSAETDTFSGFSEVFGGAHDDHLAGTNAADFLAGNGGKDSIEGRGGNDTIWGDPKFGDPATNGSGNDTITPGSGLDKVIAGPGDDLIAVRDDESDTVNCGTGSDTADADSVDALTDCEILGEIDPPVIKPPVVKPPVVVPPNGASPACKAARSKLTRTRKQLKKANKSKRRARGAKAKKKAKKAVKRARKRTTAAKRKVRRAC